MGVGLPFSKRLRLERLMPDRFARAVWAGPAAMRNCRIFLDKPLFPPILEVWRADPTSRTRCKQHY
jgi:hypothetical protein